MFGLVKLTLIDFNWEYFFSNDRHATGKAFYIYICRVTQKFTSDVSLTSY